MATKASGWVAFPHKDTAYDYAGPALKKNWERLHRGHKLAGRAALYTHRGITQVLAELNGHGIHRAADIPIVEFDRGFIATLGESLDRRSTLSLSVTEGTLYVEIEGRHLESQLVTHRLTP